MCTTSFYPPLEKYYFALVRGLASNRSKRRYLAARTLLPFTKGLESDNALAAGRDALGGGGNYVLTLNSLCFRLYAKDVFLGLAARVRVRTYCVLAHNSALLAILGCVRLQNFRSDLK
jgi:hypothetical protein